MELKNFLDKSAIQYETNVSIKEKTWLKQGGVADYWIAPSALSEFTELVNLLNSNGQEFTLVGNTSNLFFHPSCHVGVVISTLKLKAVDEKDDYYICECGANIASLCKKSVRKGYLGYYGMVNLPGTVGAAVYNNAGCYNCSVLNLIEWIEILKPDGTVQKVKADYLKASYRSTNLKRGDVNDVVIQVCLRIKKGVIADEKAKSERITHRRKVAQEGPKLNLGSVYSHRVLRHDISVKLLNQCARVLNKLHIMPYNKAFKAFSLSFFGYKVLDNYISDKNLNTFIWRDDKSEDMFELYKEYIGKLYTELQIEIEEFK